MSLVCREREYLVIKKYGIIAGVALGLTVLAELYFGTVFNESIRHVFDIPAMIFVAPGLLLNHCLRLGLPLDGPDHSAVIWISGATYTVLFIGFEALAQIIRKRWNQRHLGSTLSVTVSNTVQEERSE